MLLVESLTTFNMFLHTVLLLFVFLFGKSLQFEFIKPLKQNFDLSRPFIISRTKIVNDKHILKTFLKNGEYVSFKKTYNEIPEVAKFKSNIILIANNFQDIDAKLDCFKKYENKVFILLGDPLFNMALDHLKLEINQEIFLIKESTNEIFETYFINGIHIKMKLGMLSEEEMFWESKVEPFFQKRRANFHGLKLKAFTEMSGNDIIIDSKFKDNAPYFKTNQTFLVNGYVSGLHFDILRLMENSLNFTTQLFKPKDENWGFVRNVNGTLQGTGMVGGVFNRKADFVLSTLGLVYEER